MNVNSGNQSFSITKANFVSDTSDKKKLQGGKGSFNRLIGTATHFYGLNRWLSLDYIDLEFTS